jgi:hypothetical protein
MAVVAPRINRASTFMKALLTLLVCLVPLCAAADDIDLIAGRYLYAQYELTTAQGKKRGMREMGARRIELEIRADRKIVMAVTHLDGSVTTTTASISEVTVSGNTGHWIAHWPGMDYSVRSDFEFDSDSLSYTIRFDSRWDTARYGSSEHAKLVRQK